MKHIRVFFLSENFHCLVVKFSVYLNRFVFVVVKWINMVDFPPFYKESIRTDQTRFSQEENQL